MQLTFKTLGIGLIGCSLFVIGTQVAVAKKEEPAPVKLQQPQQMWGQQPQQQMWGQPQQIGDQSQNQNKQQQQAWNQQQQAWGQLHYFRTGCHNCHGVNARTPGVQGYPKLAGQDKTYLINQMRSLQYGVRTNNMSRAHSNSMLGLNDTQVQAMAAWLASLKW